MLMNRMKELREEKQISMKEAALGIGIPYTTYVGYEKMEREPNSEMLIQIASFFSVTVDYLICRVDYNLIMPPPDQQLQTDEKEMLQLYRLLDRDDRSEIRGEMRGMLKNEKYSKKRENVS
jgi:transcriptional regulator with XRE-family HTH domain